MCIVCDSKIENNGYQKLQGLEILDCSGCPLLTSVPEIKGLKKLYCYSCPKLTSIPEIIGLKELVCYSCPNLTSIPHIQGLKELYCYDCQKLTFISNIQGLKILNCSNCPLLTFIPIIKGLEWLYCYHCPWIPTQNNEYKSNIEKLTTIQQWTRKWLRFTRLRNFIRSREFVEWYYHPDNRGGIISKQMISQELTTMME